MNYQIIDFIKSIFSENVLKGEILQLEELIERALDYHAEEKEIDYIKYYYHYIAELNFLEEFEHFEEISFLGKDGQIVKDATGKHFFSFPFSQEDFELMLQILTLKNQVDWNYHAPFASFKMTTKKHILRATLIHSSLGNEKSSRLFLRKMESTAFSLQSFYEDKKLLEELISQKKNIIVCGPTGSGKTSLLSALMENIPSTEHVITIEDTEELIYKNAFYTPLLSSEKVSMNELLAYSLRMTPERIILGEMRSKEITTFLLAMNTGHKGLLSTLHANSASDAIDRMALMFTLYQRGESLNHNEVIRLIAKSVDIIIYMEDKKIKEIVEIMGAENGIAYFRNIQSEEAIS